MSLCGCLLHAPYWGPDPQPRHVPLLVIKWVTLWCEAGTQSNEPHQPHSNLLEYILEKIYSLKTLREYILQLTSYILIGAVM